MDGRRQSDVVGSVLAANVLGGERVQENIVYDVRSQVLVPLLQALFLIPALGAVFAGIWLLIQPLGVLLEVASTQGDLLLIAVLATCAIWGVGFLIDVISQGGKRWEWSKKRKAWYEMARALTSFAAVLICLNVAWAALGEWTPADTWRFLGGLAAIPPGGWIIWRFSQELKNPLFPPGPSIIALREFLRYLQGEQPQVIQEVVRPYPIHTGGRLAGADIASRETEDEEEEELPQRQRMADPVLRDGQWFLGLAQRLGTITRDSAKEDDPAMVTRPRRTAPSGMKLDRSYYDTIIKLLAQWGIVELGGSGSPHRLAMDPDEGIERLDELIRLVEGE